MPDPAMEEQIYQQQTDNLTFRLVVQILSERIDLYEYYLSLVEEGESNGTE